MDLCQRSVSCCVVRLWSLQTFTAVVCFKGHNYPVWSVEFRWEEEMIGTCGFLCYYPTSDCFSFSLSLSLSLSKALLGFTLWPVPMTRLPEYGAQTTFSPWGYWRDISVMLMYVIARNWQSSVDVQFECLAIVSIGLWSREKCCTFCVLCMKIYWYVKYMLCESANKALPSTWSLCFTSWYQLEEQLLPILYYAYYYWVDAYYFCVVLQVPSKW